jgi:hypothetical protein
MILTAADLVAVALEAVAIRYLQHGGSPLLCCRFGFQNQAPAEDEAS